VAAVPLTLQKRPFRLIAGKNKAKNPGGFFCCPVPAIAKAQRKEKMIEK